MLHNFHVGQAFHFFNCAGIPRSGSITGIPISKISSITQRHAIMAKNVSFLHSRKMKGFYFWLRLFWEWRTVCLCECEGEETERDVMVQRIQLH